MKVSKPIALALVVMLLLTVVAGCTSSSPTTPTTTENQTTMEPTTALTSSENETAEMIGNMYVSGLPVLKEKETYSIAVSMDPNSKNTMAEKEAVKVAEEQTNIHIEWQEIPNSGWAEKVNILIVSGDLPDAFAGHVDIMKNKDAFAIINDAIDQYAPNIQEMFEAMPAMKTAVTAPDGNIYTLPTNRSDRSSTVSEGLWINQSWLNDLNLTMPTTTDEFVEVLKAFKTSDPNKNGKDDEIPFGALQTNSSNTLDPMFGPFGVVDTAEYVYVQDGSTVFAAKQDGYFAGLSWLHLLYSEGLIDQECFTMTPSQLTAKMQSEDIIYGCIMSWLPDGMDAKYGDDYVCLPPLKGPDNDQMWTSSRQPGGEMSGFSITVDCANPEVLVRYYDNNISTLENMMLWYNGPEGAGQWVRIDGTKWAETTEFIPEGANVSEFERTVAVGPSSPAYLWQKFSDLRVNEPRIEKRIAANEIYLKYAVASVPNGLDDPERVTQRELLFTDINNYMKKFKANAIVEGISESDWQTHLQQMEQLKVDEYTDLWQQLLDSKK